MTLPDAPRGGASAHGATPPGVARTGTVRAGGRLPRLAIWGALGGLVVATITGVVIVLVGTTGGVAPRALLTVLLIAGFSAVVFMESSLASRRPEWFVLTSMGVWVATLLIGAVMTWMPAAPLAPFYGDGGVRIVSFLLIVLVLQLAVLYVRLFVKGWMRYRVTLTDVIARVSIVLVGLLVVMLVFPLMLQGWVIFHDIYWRLLVAVAILAAVGTALVPLVTALVAPRAHATPTPRFATPVASGARTWPTYPDGRTPLPVAPDGRPDWNAYRAYAAYVASLAQAAPPAPDAPAAPPAPDAAVVPHVSAAPRAAAASSPAATPATASVHGPAVPYAWAPPVPRPPVAPPHAQRGAEPDGHEQRTDSGPEAL